MPNQIAFYPQSSGGGSVVSISTNSVTGSPAASVTISGIPQTYKHLILYVETIGTAATVQNLNMQINGQAGEDYNQVWLFTTTSAPGQGGVLLATDAAVGSIPSSGAPAGTVGTAKIEFPFYSGASAKTFSFQGSCMDTSQTPICSSGGGNTILTTPITSLTFFPGSGNFGVGTTFILYGMA